MKAKSETEEKAMVSKGKQSRSQMKPKQSEGAMAPEGMPRRTDLGCADVGPSECIQRSDHLLVTVLQLKTEQTVRWLKPSSG